MTEADPIKDLIVALGSSPAEIKGEARKDELTNRINELLNSDFQRLISVLYRMDVNESKLRQLLNENPNTDASLLIANLMIERQIQKIKSRREFKQRDNDIDENEKW